MEVTLVARISIARRPTEVFKYLSNLNYHFLWNPHLQSVSPLTKLRLGASYKSVSIIHGIKIRGLNNVTKLNPPNELELENKTGMLGYKVNYQLCLREAKTLVRCNMTITSKSEAFIFPANVMKMLARRELQSDLQALKIAAEQRLK